MPPRMLPATVNCLTTSDLDVPIATSDPPEQPQSPPHRTSSPRGKTAKSPQRRRRAATITPKVSRLSNNRLIDTFRDAHSDGDLPPPKYSKFQYTFHEPEELPQPPDPDSELELELELEPEIEPLPRASLSPPSELADKIPPWFRDVRGLRYAYPPEHPKNPRWFERMFDCVVNGHVNRLRVLDNLRNELKNLLTEMTLAEIEADENLALYQHLLQDIQQMAGTKFVRTLTDATGCWHVEETDEGVEVQYDPEKLEQLREEDRSAGRRSRIPDSLAAAMSEIDRIAPSEPPYGAEPTSPAPESPSHVPSIRAQKRRQQRLRAPPPKRHRVFPPPSYSPTMQVRDSTLPPSSPIQSLPSSTSSSNNADSDSAAPPEPAPVKPTESLASLNLELDFKPSSSNFISSQCVLDTSSVALVDPPASGDPIDPNPDAAPGSPTAAPAPADSYSSTYRNWKPPKEKWFPCNLPSTIPRRPSEDDIQMAWSPKPSPSKKRSRAHRDDGDEDDDEDDADSGIIVPKRTAADVESPFRGVNDSVEVAESVSAAIGAAHRAAAKAKKKARKLTEAELEEREYLVQLRAGLQQPHYPFAG